MNLQPQASCTAFWRERERFFEMALHDGFIHFWEPDSAEFRAAPDEWVWVVEGAIVVPENAIINATFLVEVLRRSLEAKAIGRLLTFKKHLVYLDALGGGEVRRRSVGAYAAPFRFPGAHELFVQPASWWYEQVERWRTDEGNDLAFALRWFALDESRRWTQLTILSRDDWDEMKRVADLILSLDVSARTPRIHPAMVGVLVLQTGGEFSWQDSARSPSPVAPLWDVWFRWFSPALNYDLIERHLAARASAQAKFHFNFSRAFAPMSQHETMEARLQLRDWLRDRVGLPDARINELLA